MDRRDLDNSFTAGLLGGIVFMAWFAIRFAVWSFPAWGMALCTWLAWRATQ